MDLSTDTQTWPEITGDSTGKGHKLAWTQVHQGKGCVVRHSQVT